MRLLPPFFVRKGFMPYWERNGKKGSDGRGIFCHFFVDRRLTTTRFVVNLLLYGILNEKGSTFFHLL